MPKNTPVSRECFYFVKKGEKRRIKGKVPKIKVFLYIKINGGRRTRLTEKEKSVIMVVWKIVTNSTKE